MPDVFDPRPLTAAEYDARRQAQEAGRSFLVVWTPGGEQRITVLPAGDGAVTIGRLAGNDVCLDWDPNVSRVHAELRRLGPEWVLHDDGLSRNGSQVNGRRVVGRHRLHNLDVIGVGMTPLLFRAPLDRVPGTAGVADVAPAPELTPIQLAVLEALCRPCLAGDSAAVPASNKQIAGEVHLGVEAVKGHLRVLARKFGVGDLPQNAKRARLVAEARRRGALPARGPAH